MIDVETTAPVYSNAGGKERRQTRQETRTTRRTNRKTKRNAKKLKRVKMRNGKSAMIYVLSRLRAVKKSGADESLSVQYIKTYPDNTTGVIAKEDVVTTADGKFYDKNEIAKAFGVEKTAVTQQMIDRFIVPVAVTTDGTETKEVDKTDKSADGGVIIPEEKVILGEDGNPYVAEDLKNEDGTGSDDVKVDDKKAQSGMTKTQKIILGVGIGLVVLTIVYVVYRKMSTKKGK
jgi:hypothetical protein